MNWLYILVGQVVVWGVISLIAMALVFYAWHFFIVPFQRVYSTFKFTIKNRDILKEEYRKLGAFKLLKIHARNGLFKIQMNTCGSGHCEGLNYAIAVNWLGIMKYHIERQPPTHE